MHRHMICLLAVAACAQAPPKTYEYYLTGNAADVKPATRPGAKSGHASPATTQKW